VHDIWCFEHQTACYVYMNFSVKALIYRNGDKNTGIFPLKCELEN